MPRFVHHQVPDLHVFYGPDTYMGANLAQLFTNLAQMPDEEVAALHPGHTAASVASLLPRLHYFQEGTCIVHHIFGGRVTELVAAAYSDAYLTAHFEASPAAAVCQRQACGMDTQCFACVCWVWIALFC